MQPYTYTAMDRYGRTRRGVMNATSMDDLHARLRQAELDLIRARLPRKKRLVRLRSTVSRRELMTFCSQISQLTRAGIPLVQGLHDLQEAMGNSALQPVLVALTSKIQDGATFSEALHCHPAVFNQVFVHLTRAGEQSGQLPQVFGSIADNLAWEDQTIARAKKAIAYPTVVATVVLTVVVILMVFLVPQLMQFITGMRGEIPTHTRALIATSQFFTRYWLLMFGAVMGGGILLKILVTRFSVVRLWVDAVLLRLPLVGAIQRNIMLARFCQIFARMYQAGVPVLQTLHIAECTIGNSVIARALRDATTRIAEGSSINQSFSNTFLFTPIPLRMIAIGEKTGELDAALLNATSFYDREVTEQIARLETLLEPMLTVILGAVLGWIILSVLGPVYDLMGSVDSW